MVISEDTNIKLVDTRDETFEGGGAMEAMRQYHKTFGITSWP
jgi:hypothetical protein